MVEHAACLLLPLRPRSGSPRLDSWTRLGMEARAEGWQCSPRLSDLPGCLFVTTVGDRESA